MVEIILPCKNILYFNLVSERILFVWIWILRLPKFKNISINIVLIFWVNKIVVKSPFVKSKNPFIKTYEYVDILK